MENKLEKLTPEENTSLFSFIGKCVLENISFPGRTIGTDNITVQELLNNYTISNLQDYGSFLHKKYMTDDDPFKQGRKEKTFGSISVKEVVNALLLIIKHKTYVSEKIRIDKKILNLQSELEKHKTPDEIKAELEKQLTEYTSLLS